MKIFTLPHTILNSVAKPVIKVSTHTLLIDRMLHYVQFTPHVLGLAANQVGVLKRIIVVTDGNCTPFVLINPVIKMVWGEAKTCPEYCLSVPNAAVDVTRKENIVVEYRDSTGANARLQTSGLLARVIQHEIDHLDGITIGDD